MVAALTFSLTKKMQKNAPLVAEVIIYLYPVENLPESYRLQRKGTQLSCKTNNNRFQQGYAPVHALKTPFHW